MNPSSLISATVLAAMLLSTYPPVARADEDCRTGWSFGMVEDEGGPAPLAWACPLSSQVGLTLRCGKSRHLALSYFEDPDIIMRDPDYSDIFGITIGEETFDREMLYQAMDGSLITDDLPIDGPLISAMGRGSSLKMTSPEGAADEFDLTGAGEAIGQLIVLCAKAAD